MTYMLILNCALKLGEEIILYYDARSKKTKTKKKKLLHVSVQSPSSGSALFGTLIPNSVTHIHQQGPNNICSHTTE